MYTRLVTLCLVLALLLVPQVSRAEIGTIDNVPAATLLLPYFAVNLGAPNALTTLFSINNASSAPAIAHVVFWTDLSVVTLDFNVYLTGYDVVTINLRDVFIDGDIPQTTNDDMPPGLSPVGPFSVPTNPVTSVGPGTTSCSVSLPTGGLPPVLLDHIRDAHTGEFSSVLNGCAGVPYGDRIARGYITIDNVNSCTLFSPLEGNLYFGDPSGPNNVNQLWGDFFLVDATQDFAQGESLVHIEADAAAFAPGDYTFYARYVVGSAADAREGLTSTFAARYATSFGAISGGTELLVWRDSKAPASVFDCDSPLPKLSQNQIVIFDEMENPDVPESFPFSPPIDPEALVPFPWEANRTVVGGPALPVPFTSGWLYLNLNSVVAGQTFDPLPDGEAMQNWMIAVWSADGRFSVGFDALQLDNVSFGATNECLIAIAAGGPLAPVCPSP